MSSAEAFFVFFTVFALAHALNFSGSAFDAVGFAAALEAALEATVFAGAFTGDFASVFAAAVFFAAVAFTDDAFFAADAALPAPVFFATGVSFFSIFPPMEFILL